MKCNFFVQLLQILYIIDSKFPNYILYIPQQKNNNNFTHTLNDNKNKQKDDHILGYPEKTLGKSFVMMEHWHFGFYLNGIYASLVKTVLSLIFNILHLLK